MQRELYIDIESVPSQSPEIYANIAAEIAPPKSMKRAETIEAWERDEKPAAVVEKWLRTSFDGAWGEVICIGFAVDDEPPVTLSRDLGDSEAELLLAASQAMAEAVRMPAGRDQTPLWIGHYISEFDLRFLWQRHVVNRVQPVLPIPYDATAWGGRLFDTCIAWKGRHGTGDGSLDAVCRALGYHGKEGMTGADVWPAVQEGRIEDVARYCAADVRKTRLAYRRMNFLPEPTEVES